MRLQKRKHETMARADMTPMIDVVFLLIIFFVSVMQIKSQTFGMIEAPETKIKKEQAPPDVSFKIKADGSIEFGEDDNVSESRFISILESELQKKSGGPGATVDPNKLIVLLIADKKGQSGGVNRVIQIMRDLGFQQVRIDYVQK